MLPDIQHLVFILMTTSSWLVEAFSCRISHVSSIFESSKIPTRSCISLLESSASKENVLSDKGENSPVVTYSEAWRIRIQRGHQDAAIYYRELLLSNARDTSAATRIAASDDSLKMLCEIPRTHTSDAELEKDIADLRTVLKQSHYDHSSIRGHIFNLPVGPILQHTDPHSLEKYQNHYPFGPIYAKPLQPGQHFDINSLLDETQEAWKSSLKCLTVLFVLSGCIPKEVFLRAIYDGQCTLTLLTRLGLVFTFSDPATIKNSQEWIVPLVHLFPLDVPDLIIGNNEARQCHNGQGKSLVLMTDLHPNVIGMTSIPKAQHNENMDEDGMVMYIGPDSLALVQNLHASFMQYWNSRLRCSPNEPFRLVDFCTGSGVQALAVIAMLELLPSSEFTKIQAGKIIASAVDINQRALKFTRFNALLNGYEVLTDQTKECNDNNDSKTKIRTIFGDLLRKEASNGKYLLDELHMGRSYQQTSLKQHGMFDMLLANPPFIPTPPKVSDNSVLSTYNRNASDNLPIYGLFSSGGEDGEECLRAIIQIAPELLKNDGVAAIVSEFMNPPSPNQTVLDLRLDKQNLCSKIKIWWRCSNGSNALYGVLFTNEYPVSSAIYAGRRAMPDDSEDAKLWKDHLKRRKIHTISPGLLFLRHGSIVDDKSTLLHYVIPRTRLGSVWTPRNFLAVEYIMRVLSKIILFHAA